MKNKKILSILSTLSTLSIIAVILMSVLLLLSSCAPNSGGGELSSGIGYLRENRKMQKRVSPSVPTMFTLDEFEDVIGGDVSYIVVSSLPGSDFGVISLRGKPIVSGQTISAESLGLMMFSPCGDAGLTSSMSFYCRDGGFAGKEIECVMTLSDSISVPTASNMTVKAVAGIGRTVTLVDLGADLECMIETFPSHGKITIKSGRSVEYTPDINYGGTDVFTYTVCDRYGNISDSATVYIDVTENKNGVIFDDMVGNALHYEAAKLCLDGIMTYRLENGKYYFDPTAETDRIDFLVMLMDAAGCNNIYSVTDTVFRDDDALTAGRKAYLAKAVELGITDVGDGYFRPTDKITRAEAACLADRVLSLPETVKDVVFADLTSVSKEYSASVCRVISAGLMDIPKGYFYPQNALTRVENAELLSRVAEYKAKTNP